MRYTKSIFIGGAALLVLAGCDIFKGSGKVSLPDQPIVSAQVAQQKVPDPRAAVQPTSAVQPTVANAQAAVQPTAVDPSQVTEGQAPTAPSAKQGTQPMAEQGVAEAAPRTTEVKAAPANTGGGMKSRFSGSVTTRSKASMAFKVSGFIDEILVQTGQGCHKGDVLAKLDPRDYKINRDMAQAQLNLARVALTNATREYNRENALYKQKASTDSNFDRLTAGLDKAKIDVQMAELRLQQASQALEDTVLKAPYDCVVTKQVKNAHENVAVGAAVMEIYNIADLEFQFSVPENMAGKLVVGDKLDIQVPATGFTEKLEIIRLVPVITDINRSFQIVVRAPANDSRVVGGLYAEAVMP